MSTPIVSGRPGTSEGSSWISKWIPNGSANARSAGDAACVTTTVCRNPHCRHDSRMAHSRYGKRSSSCASGRKW